MNKFKILSVMLITAFLGVMFMPSATAQQPKKKVRKIVKKKGQLKRKGVIKMEQEMNNINEDGGLSVIGTAVTNEGRDDIGIRRVTAKARGEMANAIKGYVESYTHDFMEEIGVGPGSETNDVFQEMVDIMSQQMLENNLVGYNGWYQSKFNKKQGTKTWKALLYISPTAMYEAFEKEVKGGDEAIYQRYVDSEFKKDKEKAMKKFEDKFNK